MRYHTPLNDNIMLSLNVKLITHRRNLMSKTIMTRLAITAAALALSSAAFAGDFICQKNSGCPVNVDFPQMTPSVTGPSTPVPPTVVKYNSIMSTDNGLELNLDNGWAPYFPQQNGPGAPASN